MEPVQMEHFCPHGVNPTTLHCKLSSCGRPYYFYQFSPSASVTEGFGGRIHLSHPCPTIGPGDWSILGTPVNILRFLSRGAIKTWCYNLVPFISVSSNLNQLSCSFFHFYLFWFSIASLCPICAAHWLNPRENVIISILQCVELIPLYSHSTIYFKSSQSLVSLTIARPRSVCSQTSLAKFESLTVNDVICP